MRRNLIRFGPVVALLLIALAVIFWVHRTKGSDTDSSSGDVTLPVAADTLASASRRNGDTPARGQKEREDGESGPSAKPALLKGTVIDADTGEAIAGAQVRASTDDDGDPIGSTTTAATGAFEIPVSGVEYPWVFVSADGYASARYPVRVNEQSSIELQKGVIVRGRVTAGGVGQSGVRVTCHWRHQKEASADTLSGAGGRFEIDRCHAGQIVLTADSDAWAHAAVFLEGDQHPGTVVNGVEIALSRGFRISGRVLAPGGDASPGGADVYASDDVERAAQTHRVHMPHAEVALDGSFELGPLEAGSWLVTAVARDGRTAWTTVELRDAPAEDVTLQLPKGMELTGRVIAGDQPVPGALLKLIRDQATVSAVEEPGILIRSLSSGGGSYARKDVADEHGRFAFDGLERGDYTILVSHREYASEFFSVHAGQRDIVLELPVPGTLFVRVRKSDGVPKEPINGNVSIRRFDPDTGVSIGASSGTLRRAMTEGERVVPGYYEVVLMFDGPEPPPQKTEVKAGQRVELTFNVPEPVRYRGRVLSGTEPLADAQIAKALAPQGDESGRFISFPNSGTYTETDGTFRLTAAPGARFIVYHPEHADRLLVLPGEPTSGEVDLGDIVMKPGTGHRYVNLNAPAADR